MEAKEFKSRLLELEDQLMRYAYKLTVNRDDALDLFQETFLKGLSHGSKITHTNLKSWLFTIMKNIFINGYRRKLKQREWLSQVIKSDLGFFDMRSNNPYSEQNYSDIIKQLDRLDKPVGIPFKMYIKGFKYKEIAEKLELPIGTIKSRIFLGRKIVMANLKDYLN